MAENLASCPDLSSGQDVVLPMSAPIKSSGHIQILYGNLAPEGSVAKITGKEGLKFTGQVRRTHTHTHSACLGPCSCRQNRGHLCIRQLQWMLLALKAAI
jgi:dihydroxyacid dehydratase/phosphogluconate dehydratase